MCHLHRRSCMHKRCQLDWMDGCCTCHLVMDADRGGMRARAPHNRRLEGAAPSCDGACTVYRAHVAAPSCDAVCTFTARGGRCTARPTVKYRQSTVGSSLRFRVRVRELLGWRRPLRQRRHFSLFSVAAVTVVVCMLCVLAPCLCVAPRRAALLCAALLWRVVPRWRHVHRRRIRFIRLLLRTGRWSGLRAACISFGGLSWPPWSLGVRKRHRPCMHSAVRCTRSIDPLRRGATGQ